MALIAMLLCVFLWAQPVAALEAPAIAVAQAPATPLDAVGGGVVIVELSVNARGTVKEAKLLRSTPPYDTEVLNTVQRWSFRAQKAAKPGEISHVLVVAVFRPNTFPGAAMGEVTDMAKPTEDVPFPKETTLPPYPVNALGGGTVLLEIGVDPEGGTDTVRALSGAQPFVQVAEDTVRSWDFRPARDEGSPTDSKAYVVFGFREPITVPGANPDDFTSTAPSDTTTTTP